MRRSGSLRGSASILGVVTAASLPAMACAAAAPPSSTTTPTTSEPTPSSSANARIVSATVLANECANLGKVNAKLAEDAMNRLVEGCTAIPGGSIRFVATMQPGGRIEIAPAEGQPATVPICVLKHELKHKVALQKACKLEVRLEESAIHFDAGASD
jgi:hypothetical protein